MPEEDIKYEETKGRKALNFVKQKLDKWKQERRELHEAHQRGRVKGMQERGYHEGRGYKSRTQIMAERPPRYSDRRGYGRPYRERYTRYSQRESYQEQPQQPPSVMDSLHAFENQFIIQRPPKRRPRY